MMKSKADLWSAKKKIEGCHQPSWQYLKYPLQNGPDTSSSSESRAKGFITFTLGVLACWLTVQALVYSVLSLPMKQGNQLHCGTTSRWSVVGNLSSSKQMETCGKKEAGMKCIQSWSPWALWRGGLCILFSCLCDFQNLGALNKFYSAQSLENLAGYRFVLNRGRKCPLHTDFFTHSFKLHLNILIYLLAITENNM